MFLVSIFHLLSKLFLIFLLDLLLKRISEILNSLLSPSCFLLHHFLVFPLNLCLLLLFMLKSSSFSFPGILMSLNDLFIFIEKFLFFLLILLLLKLSHVIIIESSWLLKLIISTTLEVSPLPSFPIFFSWHIQVLTINAYIDTGSRWCLWTSIKLCFRSMKISLRNCRSIDLTSPGVSRRP